MVILGLFGVLIVWWWASCSYGNRQQERFTQLLQQKPHEMLGRASGASTGDVTRIEP